MNPAPAYGAGGYGNAPMPAVTKKYKMLRLIAMLMKVLAVVVGAIMIIAGLFMIVAGAAASSKPTQTLPDFGPAPFLSGLVGGVVVLVYGVFIFIFLYAYAEWMYVFMDIEENTRMTNEMLSARK